jgi:hypothetical protein
MKHGLWLSVLLLAACAQATSPMVESSPDHTGASTETPDTGATPLPTAETQTPAPASFQRPVYSLNATLDYAVHYLAVKEQIIYTNNNTDELYEIQLLVEADNLGALFTLNSLEFDHGNEWNYDEGQITVSLARPLHPGEEVTLDLDYSLTLPQAFSTLGWSARQTNFVDWYPFIPPYRDGQGWMINPSAPQGEHLAYESADFDAQINVVNAPALLQIAAPTPATETDGGFSYHLGSARRFSWSASGNYEKESMHTGSGVPVTVYFFEEQRDAAEASMRAAAQALELYSELFGAYPYDSLSIVECNFPDGMESDGLFFLDRDYFVKYDYDNTNLLTTLSAHETAHNWWYGSVGNDPANEPWLDEALATYSELLFYERFQPDDVTWWREFRVEHWNPTGWVDSTIYELTEFRPYVNAVYLRGALFLDDVRTAVGDQDFLAFLKDYAQQGAGRIVTGEEFFWRLAYAGEKDLENLSMIVNKYFRLADR